MRFRTTGLMAGTLLALSSFFPRSATQAAPPSSVTVQTVTPAGLKAAIARNKGKVVFVNFWATWCPSCIKELPDIAKLKQQNGGKVVVLLVDAYEQAPKAQIQAQMARTGHNSTLMFRSDLAAFFKAFDPGFKGTLALPVTYIYKRNGSKAITVTGEHSYAQYQKMIAPLLK